MEDEHVSNLPSQCPVCSGDLLVTRLECSSCGTEVNGTFTLGHLATLKEPHASLIELFLRVRGNVKEMERDLGLSYPTVRARLEEALEAAGFEKSVPRGSDEEDAASAGSWEMRFESDLAERIRSRVEESLSGLTRTSRRMERESERHADRDRELAERRAEILDQMERGEMGAGEAATLLREAKKRRS